jgi:hypothetical protein
VCRSLLSVQPVSFMISMNVYSNVLTIDHPLLPSAPNTASSQVALVTIDGMRKEFVSLLRSAGLESESLRAAAQHSSSGADSAGGGGGSGDSSTARVVRAVIAAGLLPQVARLQPGASSLSFQVWAIPFSNRTCVGLFKPTTIVEI